MLQWVKRLVKRLFGYIPMMEKQQCMASKRIDTTTYFCILNAGHFGPHKRRHLTPSYGTRWFWT